MWYVEFLALVCSAAFSVSAREAPTKLRYVKAAMEVGLDPPQYFSSDTGVSRLYRNGIARLNWKADLLRDIGNDFQIDLRVDKKEGDCFKEVIRTGPKPFCNSTSTLTQSYSKLYGLHASNPPVQCPIMKGHYELNEFLPGAETLNEDILTGDQLIYLKFYVGRRLVLEDLLRVIVS